MEVDDTENQLTEEGEINDPEPPVPVKSNTVTTTLDFGTGNRVNNKHTLH